MTWWEAEPLDSDGRNRNDSEFPRQPLVSVERQIETNLETGRSQTRMFVKMYFEARDSGLLAALPAELWQTLCCLATYMDADGYCYPGQRRMARELGISRQQLNARLKRVVAFRFQGRPVIHVTKERRSDAGQWARNVYKVLPISGLGIFGEKGTPAPASSPESSPGPGNGRKPVSTGVDTAPESRLADAASLDMNQSPEENEITQPVWFDRKACTEATTLVNEFHDRIGRSSARATPRELRHATELIEMHGIDLARFIADYAVRQAAVTRFQMRHFGAVCSYVDDALAESQRKRARSEQQDQERERRREEDLRTRYEAWRRLEVARVKESMQPDALAALGDATRRNLLAEYGSKLPPAAETLVRIRLTEQIAVEHGIMGFDEWKASKAARDALPALLAAKQRGARTLSRQVLAATPGAVTGT